VTGTQPSAVTKILGRELDRLATFCADGFLGALAAAAGCNPTRRLLTYRWHSRRCGARRIALRFAVRPATVNTYAAESVRAGRCSSPRNATRRSKSFCGEPRPLRRFARPRQLRGSQIHDTLLS